jgi:hypothetical protein
VVNKFDYNKHYELKVGSLVRWWGNIEQSGNEQDIDDIGLVTREDNYGIAIWWSVTRTENIFDWSEIEESVWQDQLEIIRA